MLSRSSEGRTDIGSGLAEIFVQRIIYKKNDRRVRIVYMSR